MSTDQSFQNISLKVSTGMLMKSLNHTLTKPSKVKSPKRDFRRHTYQLDSTTLTLLENQIQTLEKDKSTQLTARLYV